MKRNRKADMSPFDMGRKPGRQNIFLLPLIWAGAFFATLSGSLKIKKTGIKGLKPPYLVLSMHQGFMDYYITPLSLFPRRASYVSDIEGFANYGRRLYSNIGCIATRRFVNDISLIHNIRHAVMKNRDIIVIFPEARHSNIGTNSKLPESTGKLIKYLKLPVVIQKLKGSYLSLPIWDEKHKRKAPLEVTLEKVLDPAGIERLDSVEITALINKHFEYNEYKWQADNQIRIDHPGRALGLHKVLYLCPDCAAESEMKSHGHTIGCGACNKQWEMDEYGRLAAKNGNTEFQSIPDWYEFQRAHVIRQIENCGYTLKTGVKIEALPNEKGFVNQGCGTLEHTADGFTLTFERTGETKAFYSAEMNSVHTEYDYHGKGDCIVLSTKDCCYYLYPLSGILNVTKIQLAAEAFHAIKKNENI